MTTPLCARKSPLPRIGALPMLANARHCQPVGRPLLDADGRSALGPDPLGLTPPPGWVPDAMQVEDQPAPPEWTCAICFCRLDGPAEEEEETTISFEATMERDYIEFMASDSNDSLYEGSVYTTLGYNSTDLTEPIQSIDTSVEYGGPGKTWVRISIKVDRDGRKVMERIRAMARDQERVDAFFDHPAVVDTASIIDLHEERYVVQQLEVCGHQFHRACLKRMFSGSFNVAECPECRQYLVAEEVRYLRSDFNMHEAVEPAMQRDLARYDRLLAQVDHSNETILIDPEYVAGNPRYLALHTKLVLTRSLTQTALNDLEQQARRARQSNPGARDANGQPIATWEQMSNALNPQGSGLPPRQKFPLPPDQERAVIQHIHLIFETAVESIAALFPVRADGRYPYSVPTAPEDAEAMQNAQEVLSDDAFMDRVRAFVVQNQFTDGSTPLTPGNERIFLNTWTSLKTKAEKTGTALRSQPTSTERTLTKQLLESEYKRMLAKPTLDLPVREASLGMQRVRPQTLADFDRIARAGQYKVLGTRLFHNLQDLNDEISRIRTMHDRFVTGFSTYVSRQKSHRLIDIALRTHPLLDCGINLLNQTVRFLLVRNHEDFRRQYKYNKYFIDSGIWDVVLQIVTNGLDAPNLCANYSQQSILNTLLVQSLFSPANMERGVRGWLDLIQPDVFEIYRFAPWRIHWTTDDFFNAVTAAYSIRSLLYNNSTTALEPMLKSMLEKSIRNWTQLEAIITDE